MHTDANNLDRNSGNRTAAKFDIVEIGKGFGEARLQPDRFVETIPETELECKIDISELSNMDFISALHKPPIALFRKIERRRPIRSTGTTRIRIKRV